MGRFTDPEVRRNRKVLHSNIRSISWLPRSILVADLRAGEMANSAQLAESFDTTELSICMLRGIARRKVVHLCAKLGSSWPDILEAAGYRARYRPFRTKTEACVEYEALLFFGDACCSKPNPEFDPESEE